MQLKSNAVREGDFIDPLLGMERGKANYNSQFNKGKLADVIKKSKNKEADALDKKIMEFMEHKNKVPPPEVRHDKSSSSKADIMIPNVTLIVGGKALLENATLKLTRGRKYGLVGRNGIGKTCLINAISRSEIEKFPQGLHILQVEQEVEGDTKSVLQHILDCDIERNNLLEEFEQLKNSDTKDMDKAEVAAVGLRMTKI